MPFKDLKKRYELLGDKIRPDLFCDLILEALGRYNPMTEKLELREYVINYMEKTYEDRRQRGSHGY